MNHTIIEDTVRPFRLWHAKNKAFMPWRCYKYHRNAVIGAFIEAKYAQVGTSIEVLDIRTMKLIGVYTRRVGSVSFHKEKFNVKD